MRCASFKNPSLSWDDVYNSLRSLQLFSYSVLKSSGIDIFSFFKVIVVTTATCNYYVSALQVPCPSFKDILLLSAYSFIGYKIRVPVAVQLTPASYFSHALHPQASYSDHLHILTVTFLLWCSVLTEWTLLPVLFDLFIFNHGFNFPFHYIKEPLQ